MFKKLSKVLFSVSLAVMACGAGLLSIVNGNQGAKADEATGLSVTINEKTYTLEGVTYETDEGPITFYKIDSAEDLSLVSYMVSVAKDSAWAGYNYELQNDINLSSRGWTAIGTYDNPYTGKFNGNGYTINGLNASKDACESEVFFVGENVLDPVADAWYKCGDEYYQFETNKGYVNLEAKKAYNTTIETPTEYTVVTSRDFFYYGLFGRIVNAEISDLVMGKGCFAYRNNDEGVTAYSGILAAYAEGTTVFYNIYDAMADADAKFSDLTSNYVLTSDTEIVAGKTYYTTADAGATYTVVATPVVGEITTYYDRVYKIDTGLYTYYYAHRAGEIVLYKDMALTPTQEVVSATIDPKKIGSFVVDDKAYYYDYNVETGDLCLNLKERYIVNSVVETTVEEVVTVTNSIEVAGTTYYIKSITGGIELYTASDFSSDLLFSCEDGETGYITLGGVKYPFRYESEVLKVLAYSEVCTLGYVGTDCDFWKGNYYRLSSVQYVGVGAIDETAVYDGTINVLGSTYYYVFEVDEANNNSMLKFYEDAEFGYAMPFPSTGNANGVGTISINETNYIFSYDKTYGDLDLSVISNALTEIPYTIAETGGEVTVEELEVGTVFSFNVSTPAGNTGAYYYQKGTSNYVSSFKMIYEKGVGLANLDYNNNFVTSASSLPTNYNLAGADDYYVVSAEPGYIFDYWAVPRASDGAETIVYADGTNKGLRSYVLSADTEADGSKTYYSYTDGVFQEASFVAGASYEEVSSDATIENIIANNFQVDAKWKVKKYTVYVDVDGTQTSYSIGYGMRWDSFVSTLTKEGYDLTGVYHYSEGYGISNSTAGNKIYAYSLNYYYDTKGNLSNFSYLKSSDTEADVNKEYYSLSGEVFTLVELPTDITTVNPSDLGYFEKAENVAIYGEQLSAGIAGYQYFMVDWDNGNETETIYLYTNWQKQPVNGKLSFTNTTDTYILTSDEDIITGKNYYTYDSSTDTYTLVSSPVKTNISTYYEVTDKFLDNKFAVPNDGFTGVADNNTAVSMENDNTDFFMKLSTDDDATKFGVKFTLNTGYKVNYIVPENLGTLDITNVNYYVWDANAEEGKQLLHVYYDSEAETPGIKEEYVTNIIVGHWNSSTSFTEHVGVGSEITYTAGGTNALSTDMLYVDLYHGGSEFTGYAEVYAFTTDSVLVPVVSLHRNQNAYTYLQNTFTVNSYKLWIDIEREVFQVKMTVTHAPNLDGEVTFQVTEDGVVTQTISGVKMLGDLYTEQAYIDVKYDSYYEISATPSASYRLIEITHEDMDPLAVMDISNGNGRLAGYFNALNYSSNLDDYGNPVENHPELKFSVAYLTFDVSALYDFSGEKYDGNLYYTAYKGYGVLDPELKVQPVYGSTQEEQNTITKENVTDGAWIKDLTCYQNSALFFISSNAYYTLENLVVDVYGIALENVEITSGAETENFTIISSGELFTRIEYKGTTYYVLNENLTGTDPTYAISGANLYSLLLENQSIESGNALTEIYNGYKIVVKPTLKKQVYNLTTDEFMNIGGSHVEIRDVAGQNTTESGNVAYVKDENEYSVSTYSYGDTVHLTYDLEDKYYTFKSWYLRVGEVSYKIADLSGGTFQISENFNASSTGVIRYGSAIANGNEIILTFDVAFGSVPVSDVTIYGVFEGKQAELKLSGATDVSGEAFNAVVYNYDGTSSIKAYSYFNNIINTGNTTINADFVFGNPTEKVIAFSMAPRAQFVVRGWAVYNKNSIATTTEGRITMLYDYGASNLQSGDSLSLAINYYNLFINNNSTDFELNIDTVANVALLKSLFEGTSELYLIPVLQQKTITIDLGAGTGELASGKDAVTGLTYYAGGAGLDLSAYAEHFVKFGYSPIGWQWVDDSGNTTYYDSNPDNKSSNPNLINLNNISSEIISGFYNNKITLNRSYSPNKYKIYIDLETGETLKAVSGVEILEDTTGKYISVTFDSSYVLPDAEKTGYTFNGWRFNSTSISSTGTYNTYAEDITIVPMFDANDYNVRLNANGGLVNGKDAEVVSVEYDSLLSDVALISTAPTRQGYTFEGWYALNDPKGTDAYAITTTDVLSVNLGEANKFVKLENNNVEGSGVLVLVAAWSRNASYYSIDRVTESYEEPYNATEQTFAAITDVKAGGTSIFTSATNAITTLNGDVVTFEWSYKSEESGSYIKYEGTSDSASVKLTNVAQSGYYKLKLTFKNAGILLNSVMTNEQSVVLENEIYVEITPLVVGYTNLGTSYTGTFNGVSGANIDGKWSTTSNDGLNIGLDFGALTLNNAKINVVSYEVGNKEGSTFTAGSDVATYNTIRFRFSFTDGYTFVNGNYNNVITDPSNANYFFFDQATSVQITPMNIVLSPVTGKLIYTGSAQVMDYLQYAYLSTGEAVTVTASGTLTEGNWGRAGETVDDIDPLTMTISNRNVDKGNVGNYNIILGTAPVIYGENVNTYGFLAHLFTKVNSDSAFSPSSTIEKNISIESITLTVDSEAMTIAASSLKTFSDGVSYAISSENLLFQLNNNSKEVALYSLYPITSITLASDNETYTVDTDTYYLFGLYANEGDLALRATTALTDYASPTLSFSTLVSGKTYIAGYTDVVKLSVNGLGNGGNNTEIKFVKFDSALTFEPTRPSYEFAEWTKDDAETRISFDSDNKIVITSDSGIAPASVTATWRLLPAELDTTNNITINASEGTFEISVEDILGGIIEEKIKNYNNEVTYSFKWYDKAGNYITDASSIELSANTDSNGTYKLEILNADTTSSNEKEVTFTVTVNTVELAISAEGTYTTKTGNFQDGNVELADNKFTYTYSYANAYEGAININVPASTATTKVYNLASSLNVASNVYFEITKIKDASGATITEAVVGTLVDAGTYKITLKANSKIYTVATDSYIFVEIQPYSYAFTNENLTTLFGLKEGGEIFEKTYGGDNSDLTRTIYVGNGNVFSGTDTGSLGSITVEFAGTATGLGFDADNAAQVGPDRYAITLVRTDNTNYNFTVATPYPNFLVKNNDAGILTITMQSATSYIYGDKAAITSVVVEWLEAGEDSQWVLNGKDAGGNVIATWKFTQFVHAVIVDPTDSTFAFDQYEFAIDGGSIVDAGTYASTIFTVNAKDGAPVGNAEIVSNGNVLTISQRTLTVSSVSKICDTTTIFNSSSNGYNVTLSNLIDGDEITVSGTFASSEAGAGIVVTGLQIAGADAANYTLASTSTTGEIEANSDDVTIELVEDEFVYGTITDETILANLFVFTFETSEISAIDASFFTVSDIEIVDATYTTTGKYLKYKEGGYVLRFKVASTSFSAANETFELPISITQITLTPTYDTITKVYNGNTAVEQNIVVTPKTGDVVSVLARYTDASVGTGKEVTFELQGVDAGNYLLSVYSVTTGEITARDSITIIVVNPEFVEDTLLPSGTGYTNVSGSTNLSLIVSGYGSTVTTGEQVMEELVNPTRTGFTFKGFYEDAHFTTGKEISSSNIMSIINTSLENSMANATIYAKWEINKYTVTEVAVNNTTIDLDVNEYEYFSTVEFTATVEAGYDLAVYYYKNGAPDTKTEIVVEEGKYTFTMPAYNVTVQTQATPKQYGITYNLDSGEFATVQPNVHTYGTGSAIANPTRTGYNFAGWKVNGEQKTTGGESLTLGATDYLADIILTATWTPKTYNIYFDLADSEYFNETTIQGLQKVEDAGSTYNGMYYLVVEYDSTLALPVPLKDGYGFINWLDESSNVIASGTQYKVDRSLVVTADFVAGEFNVTFDLSHATVTVYNGTESTEFIVEPQSGTTYTLTGGVLYIVVVRAETGYTVSQWTYNGRNYTDKAGLNIIETGTIAIAAAANENTITLTINEQDKKGIDVVVAKVDGTTEEVTSVTGKYTFKAKTGQEVALSVKPKAGYTLNEPTNIISLSVTGSAGEYIISDFTSDGSLAFSVTAKSYPSTINKDENGAVTDLSFENSPVVETFEGYWTAQVTTGANLTFKPTINTGFDFVGVALTVASGVEIVSKGQNSSNIAGTGVNISILASGTVTVTGYTDSFTLTIVTAKQEYQLTLHARAINEEKKNDSNVGIAINVNDVAYDPLDKERDYGSAIRISTSSDAVGYKFIGWFTSITEDASGITYNMANLISSNAEYPFDMPATNVTYYAIYEISFVDITFAVVTNDNVLNVRGGKVVDVQQNEVSTIRPLFNESMSYTAVANSGYKFVGWYYLDGNGDKQEATELEGYTIETLETDAQGTLKSEISFSASNNVTIWAMFEAKDLTMDIRTALLVKGIPTYPNESENPADHLNYGNVVWGTYSADSGFIVDPNYGTGSRIYAKTDQEVFLKATGEAGYLIEQVVSTGTASFSVEKIVEDETENFAIFKLTGLNADAGEFKLTVRFYSTETTITLNYVKNGTILSAGQAEVTRSSGIAISGNRTANVIVTAITNSTVEIRAYTRLGYRFATEEDVMSPDYGKVRLNLAGSYRGEVVTTVSSISPANTEYGFTQLVTITVEGYTGGYINLSLEVKPDNYNVRLYSRTGSLITTIQGVSGGEVIELGGTAKDLISQLEEVDGFSLIGFYTYANGTGMMYIDAKGNGTQPLNDNGYYWNGSYYDTTPYFSVENGVGTFSLFAVYKIDKTAITIIAAPVILETIAPTVSTDVVIGNLNSANSWQMDSAPFYAEVLYGAKVSASAPKFDGYVFAFWKIERVDKNGDHTIRFNANENIADLAQDGYTSITLTAVYYVQVKVSATSGGSAVVKGYEYSLSSDGTTTNKLEKNVTKSYYLSSLDTIVYKATPQLGYTFLGWYDQDDQLVTTSLEYQVVPAQAQPTNLTAKFVGDAKTLRVVAATSSIGNIVKVARGLDGLEEEEITSWSEFSVKVGDQIIFYVDIPDQSFEAVWTGGTVYNDFGGTYRKYIYTVKAEDEVVTDIIELRVDYQSRQFTFKVKYALENQVSNDELKLAGKVVYGGNEIRNGYEGTTIYGRVIQLNVTANRNYQISKVLVDGIEIEDIDEFIYGGTINIQTSEYDYTFQQHAEIEIYFSRCLWVEQASGQYQLAGKGTSDNPYKITSEEDLAYVAYMINIEGSTEYASAHYELMKDLDMTGKYWSPIGTVGNPFIGSFDFNVYEITGVAVVYGYAGSTSHSGVFGVTFNANIFRTESNVGLIIGIVAGSLAVIGVTVGIFLGIRAKKKREIDKLANS